MPIFPDYCKKLLILVILSLSLTFGYHSLVLGQFPQFPTPGGRVDVYQIGNLESAWVKLDGRQLFKVAATVETNDNGSKVVSPVIQRVKQIENSLLLIINLKFDPNNLKIEPGILNGETVILASDLKTLENTPILTVTAADAQLYGKSINNTAKYFSETIQQALIDAYSDRQPLYLKRQAINAITIFLATCLISFGLIIVQKKVKGKLKTLQQESPENQGKNVTLKQLGSLEKELKNTAAKALKLLTDKLQEISYERKLNINILLRQFLQGLQIAIWLGAIAWILQLFPYTRQIGVWLLDRPIKILLVWLFVILANRGSDVLIDSYLKTWVETESLNDQKNERYSLRIPTFAAAIKGVSSFIFTILGLLFTLEYVGIPIGPVLAGAGILGFAVSFASQSLIKDVINGCLILWEDQYAVGDIIKIGEVSGLVEDMNLRITQLRDVEGQLITIPNGSISIVRNLSSEWSRVNFSVEVSHETDIDRVIGIMEEVSDRLYQDPQWHPLILDKPEVLGIENISHTGVLMRLLIKTKPTQQWVVAREFRLRLKRAFDEKQIVLGSPQQFTIKLSPFQ